MDVLDRTGVTGEYGFMNECINKKQLIEPWLDDKNINVCGFAKRFHTAMDMRIIQENSALKRY